MATKRNSTTNDSKLVGLMETRAVIGARGKMKGKPGIGLSTYKADASLPDGGVSLTLHGIRYPDAKDPKDRTPYSITFKIGDMAVYDSYNLEYTGKIVDITRKQVVIAENMGKGREPRLHRLSLYEFEWRNWDFDAERIAARNHDVMRSI